MNIKTQYRYSLDISSRKAHCPGCGKKRLVLYVDTETGKYLPDHVGRCDREDNCGYHFTPKQFFADNPIKNFFEPAVSLVPAKEQINRPIDFLPFDLMDRSVSQHRKCDLFPFLAMLFRENIADQLCNDYLIGTNKQGFTAFWQVDIVGNIRQCKIIQYQPDGHRNKSTGVIFAGKKILNNQEANLQQCFFGEFLLNMPGNENKSIAICESEKTAIIASVYYPEFVWLATGGKHGARWTEANVCKVLSGRKVILFPDLGAFDLWKAKSLLMATTAGSSVTTSDLLENSASHEDRTKGLDLADYLLSVQDGSGLALTDYEYPIMWDYKISA